MNNAGIIDLVPTELRQAWAQDGIYPNQSVYALFRQHALQRPEQAAVLAPEGIITYRQLLDKADRLANSLLQIGIVPGDTIAYQLSNSWRSSAIDLAVAALGAIVAPFPPGRGRLDIVSLLRRSGARAIVIEPEYGGINFCELVESIRPQVLSLRFMISSSNEETNVPENWLSLAELFKNEPVDTNQLPEIDPNSPVRMLVSSGTESEPKLVAYSHNALIGGRGRFLQRIHPDGESFRGLYLVPLGSSFGSTATFGILSWLGGSIAVLPKFNADEAVKAIADFKPTYILGVPTMFQRMMASPLLAETDLSSLIGIVSGGALIDKATIERCMSSFECKFISLYGSADGVNCHTMLTDGLDIVSYSVGEPNPSVCDITIIDEKNQEVPQGAIGEIRARGPLSPMQYVNEPELDDKYRDENGWVYTGDLGFIDSKGYLVLAGRKKDVIIRGGGNISPVQIENLAVSHPNVLSAACVPVSDKELGHRICICISLKEGVARLSLNELTRYLTEKGLEINKLPEFLVYQRVMPLAPSGKLDKAQLARDVDWIGTHSNIEQDQIPQAKGAA